MNKMATTEDRIMSSMLWETNNVQTYFLSCSEKAKKQPGCHIFDIEITNFRYYNEWFGTEKALSLNKMFNDYINSFCVKNDALYIPIGLARTSICGNLSDDEILELQRGLSIITIGDNIVDYFTPIIGISDEIKIDRDIEEYFNESRIASLNLRRDLSRRICKYTKELTAPMYEEYEIIHNMDKALQEGRITFYVQPQCNLKDRKLIGAECLARWKKEDGTFIPPDKFIRVLEKYNLVTTLDTYIWENVCKWIKACKNKGLFTVPISINVSIMDIENLDIVSLFNTYIDIYEIDKKDIKIEITESAYGEHPKEIIDTVNNLKENGYNVLMDDFGSGYSSLNTLSDMEFDVIKMDAQFLALPKESEKKGVNIFEAIFNMTRQLGTPIIVEGVEEQGQVDFLEALGCTYIQGFYMYRPMPIEKFEEIIADKENIDNKGIKFKDNREIHIREMLDPNLYSESMLAEIIGPVAYYRRKGDEVDIIRYNQKFFDAVGIKIDEMSERRNNIAEYIVEKDKRRFFDMFDYADEHRTVGAKAVIGAYTPEGMVRDLFLHAYYIRNTEEGKIYYVSARDVTSEREDNRKRTNHC